MVFADFVTTLKSQAWIAAIILLLIAIFRDLLRNALVKGLSALGSLLYGRLAGSRLLRRRALGKYKQGLLTAVERIPVPFRPNRPLVLSEIYVSVGISESQEKAPSDISSILSDHPRVVVTGPPGAGKSMLLRHVAARGVETARGRIPVVLELHRLVRDADNGGSIKDHLVEAFDRYGFPRAEKFLRLAIEKGWLVLLFDGLDEVPAADRVAIAGRLSDFLERERACPAIITCRSAVYKGELDAVVDQRVELEPLEDQQIQAFLDSWGEPMPPGKSAGQLMSALREQPKLLAAARNPLLLTIITHLYSDRPTYALPRSRADFYSQAAEILLDQWQGHLGQNQFEGPEKKTVLCALALEMQEISRDPEQDRRTISREAAFASVRTIMPTLGLDEDQVGTIVREIVERSGLLLQIDGGNRYAFAHLTFQEYFAAEALRDHSSELAAKFEADLDAWREVVVLWCGLAPNCTSLIEKVRVVSDSTALACVAEARSVDQALARAVIDPIFQEVVGGGASEEAQRGLGAVGADVRPRGDAVLQSLIEKFEQAEDKQSLVSVGTALSVSNRLPAAEAIVGRLTEEPGLAEAVIRMGGLAAPSLQKIGEKAGCLPIVCECLARIGTPEAAKALAHIMASASGSEIPAAWGLAHVINNPGVIQELKDFRIPPSFGEDSLSWIWEPFSKPGEGRSVIWLVGRAAALIQRTKDMELAIAVPDPRIATALSTLNVTPLETPLDLDEKSWSMVKKLRDLTSDPELSFDRKPRRAVSEREESYRLLHEVRPVSLFSRRNIELETMGDLAGVLAEAVDSPWGDEVDSDLTDAEDFVDILLNVLEEDHPLWVKLVRGLPPGLRAKVLLRMNQSHRSRQVGEIGPSTWPSVCVVSPFRFRRSAYYMAVLAGMFVLTAMAGLGGLLLIANNPGWSLERILVVLGWADIGLSWAWLYVESEPSTSFGRIDPDSLAEALLGPLLLVLTIYEELKYPPALWGEVVFALPTIGFAPALLLLSLAFLAAFLPTGTSLAVLLAMAALGIFLAFSGTRRESSLRTPLIGLFPEVSTESI